MAERIHTVGILGAGTMGAGIAQVAACGGWRVKLKDVDLAIAQRAIDGVKAQLAKLAEKGRMTEVSAAEAVSRIAPTASDTELSDCDLIVEAIVEDLTVKTRVLGDLLRHVRSDCIIATNTSSLSVSKIGQAIGLPRRTVGMHFFNPAPVMRLVEVIAGSETDAVIVDRIAAIAESWGKKVARAADVPGFIVNHVARPYYLEAFRILEDGFAAADHIDAAMRTLGGFRMGPLELTDFIGHDVNTATTRNVWEQLGRPPLLRPSELQESLVANGHFGRKSGRGVYSYSRQPPAIELRVELRPAEYSRELTAAVEEFIGEGALAKGKAEAIDLYIVSRIVAAIIVQACLAYERGVASKADIDTAMRHGVNYPRGPFEWIAHVGAEKVVRLLEALNETVIDDRFATPSTLSIRETVR